MRAAAISLMVVCVCACVEGATYSGGSGAEGDPYLIGSAGDIIEMSGSPADWGAHYLMIADVNMAGYTFERAVIAPDEDDMQDYFQGTSFTGVFDGGWHKIVNLSVGGGGYLGLFGELVWGGLLCNLGLEGVDIQGTGDHVGGLVGVQCVWYD